MYTYNAALTKNANYGHNYKNYNDKAKHRGKVDDNNTPLRKEREQKSAEVVMGLRRCGSGIARRRAWCNG